MIRNQLYCIMVSRYHWVRGRRGSDRGLLGLKIGLICMIADNVEESEPSSGRDHGMDTQDLEFKFFAKRVETSYVVTATYV